MLVQAPTANRMTGTADCRPWPFGLAGDISVGLLYGLVYAAIRLSFSHNLPVDDIKSNVYTQTLELGYVAKQPPRGRLVNTLKNALPIRHHWVLHL